MSSSLAPRLALLASALLIPALGACWVEPDQAYIQPTPTPQPTATTPPAPATAQIATGETLVSDPGNGAGVFVEYHGEGSWHVWTTCDTLRTQKTCRYKLTLGAEAGSSFQKANFAIEGSGNNELVTVQPQQIVATVDTSTETDRLEVRLDPPGSSLQLESEIDGIADGRIIFWIGPDTNSKGEPTIHTGAPTNPLIFEPSKP